MAFTFPVVKHIEVIHRSDKLVHSHVSGYNIENRLYGDFLYIENFGYILAFGVKFVGKDIEFYANNSKIYIQLTDCVKNISCIDSHGYEYYARYGSGYYAELLLNNKQILHYNKEGVTVHSNEPFHFSCNNDIRQQPLFRLFEDLPIYNKSILHFNLILADIRLKKYRDELEQLEQLSSVIVRLNNKDLDKDLDKDADESDKDLNESDKDADESDKDLDESDKDLDESDKDTNKDADGADKDEDDTDKDDSDKDIDDDADADVNVNDQLEVELDD